MGLPIEFRPADYAEIVALPIPSRCGRSEIPRQNPELGIRPIKAHKAGCNWADLVSII